jgi:hypothetical protein
VLLPLLALGANAPILQPAAEYAIIAQIIGYPPRKVKGWAVNIVQPTAPNATNVFVPLNIAVKPRFPAAELQLLDRPQPAEQIQVAVYRPEADPGHSAADDLIKAGSGRVRCEILKFFKNHLPLSSISLERVAFHKCHFS